MFMVKWRSALFRSKQLFGLLIIGLVLGSANAAAPQSKEPDFSLVDPAWAASQVDNNFQNGDGAPAWRALKRDFPQDYNAFVKAFVSAILNHGDKVRISGDFIQSHIELSISLAPRAPSSALARLQRNKAAMIRHLSTTDVAACAAFASGDQEALKQALGVHMDVQSLRLSSEIDAALFDAAVAAQAEPNARAVMDANDINTIKKLALAHGGTPAEVDSMFSSAPNDKLQRCRIGVLFFDAIAAAPDATAAKFAFR